jgi:hypothetical protein
MLSSHSSRCERNFHSLLTLLHLLLLLYQRPTIPLRAMFRTGMPGTKLVLGVFGSLGEKYVPNIWHHLEQENIHHSMFATSWFMTVYTNSFPFDLVTRIFDVMWYEGWKIVYRVALALLKVCLPVSLCLRPSHPWSPSQYSEDEILSHDFEHIMFYFRSLPKSVDYVRLWKVSSLPFLFFLISSLPLFLCRSRCRLFLILSAIVVV